MSDETKSESSKAIPVFQESIAGALIDSARISVMAALSLLPRSADPLIIVPGASHDLDPDEFAEDPIETVNGCLDQAMSWLDAARQHTIEAGAPVTSLHVAGARR